MTKRIVIHNHVPRRARDEAGRAVSREEEERNRDRVYKDTGIRRIGRQSHDLGKPNFEQWMKEVDRWCEKRHGISIHDLPDCPFRDWFDDNVAAASAAARCVRRAKE